MKEKKIQKKYAEEFKRQAVELVIHSGKTQAQIARELGVSGYSFNLWKKALTGFNASKEVLESFIEPWGQPAELMFASVQTF